MQEVLARLPWYHQLALLEKLSTTDERRAYAHVALEHEWSRNVLVMQIEARTIERRGKEMTNFADTLPAAETDLAREALKDPYKRDFLGLGADAHEREIEQAIVGHFTEFLLELGAGFAFVDRQVHLEVGVDDFFIDCSDSRVIPIPA